MLPTFNLCFDGKQTFCNTQGVHVFWPYVKGVSPNFHFPTQVLRRFNFAFLAEFDEDLCRFHGVPPLVESDTAGNIIDMI